MNKKKENLLPYLSTYKTKKEITVNELDSLITINEIFETKSKAIHPTSNNFVWIKFVIPWVKGNRNRLLELNNPHINNVILYEKSNDNKYKKIGFGGDITYKFHERSHYNRRFTFPLNNKLEKTTYYLMVDNRNAIMLIPLWLWDKLSFEQNERKENIFYMIYFSFIFFIGFFSVIISLFTKKRIFLDYAFYVWSLWMYLFTLLGFSFQYIYPNNTNITSDTRYISIVLLIIMAMNFMISFLKMKYYAKYIFRIVRVIQYIFLAFLVIYFFDKSIFYEYHITLTYFFRTIYFIIICCVLISVFKIRKIETKRAQLFITSVLFVILGFIIFIGIQLDIIPHFWFNINPIIIGVGIEVFVLSIAMFYILKKTLLNNINLKSERNNLIEEVTALNIALKSNNDPTNNELIHLKSKAILNSREILYIKSDGHYVEYYLDSKSKPEIDRNSLNKVAVILPSDTFTRIHKSYIVNIHRIKIINSTKVMLDNGVWINLSRTYKQQLKDILHKED